jgi:hypothetical protein
MSTATQHYTILEPTIVRVIGRRRPPLRARQCDWRWAASPSHYPTRSPPRVGHALHRKPRGDWVLQQRHPVFAIKDIIIQFHDDALFEGVMMILLFTNSHWHHLQRAHSKIWHSATRLARESAPGSQHAHWERKCVVYWYSIQ